MFKIIICTIFVVLIRQAFSEDDLRDISNKSTSVNEPVCPEGFKNINGHCIAENSHVNETQSYEDIGCKILTPGCPDGYKRIDKKCRKLSTSISRRRPEFG